MYIYIYVYIYICMCYIYIYSCIILHIMHLCSITCIFQVSSGYFRHLLGSSRLTKVTEIGSLAGTQPTQPSQGSGAVCGKSPGKMKDTLWQTYRKSITIKIKNQNHNQKQKPIKIKNLWKVTIFHGKKHCFNGHVP